jgi:uncharacterized protein (DUF2147 family)
MRRILASMAVAAALSVPAFAQEASIEGNWVDEYGTAFKMELCGEDGTALCATLLDVQGESRTEENLAYVNEQVINAQQTAPGTWEGTLIFDGSEARGKVTQLSADAIAIEGCRGIFCSTLTFNRA